ncbi:MAG TPA: aminotransferase class I/II-fold pyridoxal phosphate-dependent enzyme [Clostridia bacterium]|jgi:aromatic-amino-acid transaminase|nr:aminotransferase class I/II-fold pyridoxal phosphate-dependent enzyme [Clostridia bacterium]
MEIAAPHAAGKGKKPDAVFSILQRANQAVRELGTENVINASIGAIYDEEEKFAFLPTVKEYLQQLPASEMMSYAPIAGLPEFEEAVIKETLGKFQPENTFVRALATPGGTGAVRHVVYNYTQQGEKVLVPDWAWGPYWTIAAEHQRQVEVYQMFNSQGELNLESLQEKIVQLLEEQEQLVIIFNTPAHNPTGYSITNLEWEKMLSFFREYVLNKRKKIILLLDLAYLDYAGTKEETRSFMRLFSDLPESILITMAFSMSKSYLIYGLRSGALIGLSSSEKVIAEFYRVNVCSNRGVWSNGTRCAQRLLAEVAASPTLSRRVEQERADYTGLLQKRAGLFLKEAKEVDLALLPYQSGFFITIPTKQPGEIAEKLREQHFYTVPLAKGIRIAICGVPTYKIPGMASRLKEVLG